MKTKKELLTMTLRSGNWFSHSSIMFEINIEKIDQIDEAIKALKLAKQIPFVLKTFNPKPERKRFRYLNIFNQKKQIK